MADGYETRIEALLAALRALPGAVVAFSGGVDSAALVFACRLALGERVLAVTAVSASLPDEELAEARAFCAAHGLRHELVRTRELARAGYRRNAPDRCFHCKDELFGTLAAALAGRPEAGWPVLYGAIADDLAEHRPGGAAARAHGVRAPLAEAGLSKADVRRFSRSHGLGTAEKPAFACLASRVPYGTPVDAALLARLAAAEAVLRNLGYRQFRVRHHDTVARVELLPEDLPRALAERHAIQAGIAKAGYTYVALDLLGYRAGAMNEVLP